jgi:SAM-dependent methyltransferase
VKSQDIVRQGYDRVSYVYRDAQGAGSFVCDYAAWLAALTPHLVPGAAVLDLGCGCGIPVACILAPNYAVTGVDISPVQVERARQLAPEAHFLCADMLDVDFPPASFDAIVSFYAIIHVPLEEQPGLLRKLARWLKPGGHLMATVGSTAWTGTEENWLGVPGATMYWSHADSATYAQWLGESGFTLCWTRFIPEGSSGHTLVLARANSRSA